jgi:hypothetical protein
MNAPGPGARPETVTENPTGPGLDDHPMMRAPDPAA